MRQKPLIRASVKFLEDGWAECVCPICQQAFLLADGEDCARWKLVGIRWPAHTTCVLRKQRKAAKKKKKKKKSK